ncbi:MAG: DUF4136 domain-containing protein [Melioribacteraceae bacterium]|nr:DUF4136 domain-containing protein [Melioribacteraceae bacterium]
MKYFKAVLVIGLLSFWGCASMSTTMDYDPNTDFSKYKTYSWFDGEMPADDALSANPLAKKRVVSSIDSYLASKGYTSASSDVDFVVIVHAGTKEKMQINNYGYGGYGYGMYGRGWGPGYGPSQTDVTYYDETTLVIDIADADKKELVWRGTGTGIIRGKLTDEERDEVIATILANFPPKK